MVDKLLEVKIHVSFVECLEILWKLRKKHQRMQKQTFQQVSKIFKIFRKSSEKIGECRKVLKTTNNTDNF